MVLKIRPGMSSEMLARCFAWHYNIQQPNDAARAVGQVHDSTTWLLKRPLGFRDPKFGMGMITARAACFS